MTSILGEYRMYKGQHRLFYPSISLSTLASAIVISATVIKQGTMRLNPGDTVGFESFQFPLDVQLPLFGPIHIALDGKEPNSTFFKVTPAPPTWTQGTVTVGTGIPKVSFYACTPIFVEYFEAHRPWLDDNVSRNQYQWPFPWTFAWLVRNAIVHNNGRIAWSDPNRPSISWHHITYSIVDDTRQIIGPDYQLPIW